MALVNRLFDDLFMPVFSRVWASLDYVQMRYGLALLCTQAKSAVVFNFVATMVSVGL
jgi:hypothetical protein